MDSQQSAGNNVDRQVNVSICIEPGGDRLRIDLECDQFTTTKYRDLSEIFPEFDDIHVTDDYEMKIRIGNYWHVRPVPDDLIPDGREA